jgi:hypothetical protein
VVFGEGVRRLFRIELHGDARFEQGYSGTQVANKERV